MPLITPLFLKYKPLRALHPMAQFHMVKLLLLIDNAGIVPLDTETLKLEAYKGQNINTITIAQYNTDLAHAGLIRPYTVRDDHPYHADEEYAQITIDDADLPWKQDFRRKSAKYPTLEDAAPPPEPDLADIGGTPSGHCPDTVRTPSGQPTDKVPPEGRRKKVEGRRLKREGRTARGARKSSPSKKKKNNLKKQTTTDLQREQVGEITSFFIEHIQLGKADDHLTAGEKIVLKTLKGEITLPHGVDPPTYDEIMECLKRYAQRRNREKDEKSKKTRPHIKNYFDPKDYMYRNHLKDIREEDWEKLEKESQRKNQEETA